MIIISLKITQKSRKLKITGVYSFKEDKYALLKEGFTISFLNFRLSI